MIDRADPFKMWLLIDKVEQISLLDTLPQVFPSDDLLERSFTNRIEADLQTGIIVTCEYKRYVTSTSLQAGLDAIELSILKNLPPRYGDSYFTTCCRIDLIVTRSLSPM